MENKYINKKRIYRKRYSEGAPKFIGSIQRAPSKRAKK